MIYVEDIKRIFSDTNRTHKSNHNTLDNPRYKSFKHNIGVADNSVSEFGNSDKIHGQNMANEEKIEISENVEMNWILRLTIAVLSLSLVGLKLVWTYLTYRPKRSNSAK